MKNWFNPADAADLFRRLDGLTADARPRWGRFTPEVLVCHLAEPIRVALGEKGAQPLKGPLRLPGLSQLVVWWMPWPKGAPTAPEFLPGTGLTASKAFEADKKTLIDLLRRFSESPAEGAFPENPVFGRLSRQGWGRLVWRHLDHHLRQFGL